MKLLIKKIDSKTHIKHSPKSEQLLFCMSRHQDVGAFVRHRICMVVQPLWPRKVRELIIVAWFDTLTLGSLIWNPSTSSNQTGKSFSRQKGWRLLLTAYWHQRSGLFLTWLLFLTTTSCLSLFIRFFSFFQFF